MFNNGVETFNLPRREQSRITSESFPICYCAVAGDLPDEVFTGWQNGDFRRRPFRSISYNFALIAIGLVLRLSTSTGSLQVLALLL